METRYRRRDLGVGVVLTILGAGLIAAVELATPAEVSLTSLYAVIVVLSAWRFGYTGAIVATLVCTCAAVVSRHVLLAGSASLTRHEWWEGALQGCTYALVSITVANTRERVRRERELLRQLQAAMADVRRLEGLLPICAWCKRMRDDEREGRWVPMEEYMASRTSAAFTHGICPQCEAELRKRSGEPRQT